MKSEKAEFCNLEHLSQDENDGVSSSRAYQIQTFFDENYFDELCTVALGLENYGCLFSNTLNN